MRRSAPALLALLVCLSACTQEPPPRPSTASTAPSPSPTSSLSVEQSLVIQAIDKVAELGEGGYTVRTATITDLGTGAFGVCSTTSTQIDAEGSPVAVDTSVGIASAPDVDTMCDSLTPSTHIVAIGTAGYVESPAMSGSYVQVTLSPDLATDLASTSARYQVRQFEAVLTEAISLQDEGDGQYTATFDTLEVAQQAGAYAGLSDEQVSGITGGITTVQYRVDPTTGMVNSVRVTAELQGTSTISITTLSTFTWSLDSPIAAPTTLAPGDPVEVSTLEELSQAALGQ